MSGAVEKDEIYQNYQNLCADLNMNKEAIEEAWRSYIRINSNYTLEGDRLHWLTCALYVACRSGKVPTISRESYIEGNCVSLTRLLRSSQLSLIQFFIKMKKWCDMANLPKDTRERVERLERNFNVSAVIFKKFEPIFCELFRNPANDPPKPVRSRKQRKLPCTASDVFSFCWILFIYIKGRFPNISDDLVNSYHVLLCCIDLIYNNALLGNLKDLLNPDFEGLPEMPLQEPVCLIQHLCSRHTGVEGEAKLIKEHHFKLEIRSLLEKGILKGRVDNFSGLLDLSNFEANQKALVKKYEEHVLSFGDFDERIFLGENANKEIGTPAKKTCLLTEIRQRIGSERGLYPATPLTNRLYLKDRDDPPGGIMATPISSATQGVARLQALLLEYKNQPSESLLALLKESKANNLQEIIASRLKDLGETFCKAYSQPSEDSPSAIGHMDFALKRLQMAECLYYKCLESILKAEKRKHPNSPDCLPYVENDPLNQSLFACCMEIVLFSYNSQRKFPWILEVLDLQACQFYKVIELIIREENSLTRDVVKHLNNIEEQILECLAWKHDSHVWEWIKSSGQPIPSCEDVSLPSSGVQNNILGSPIVHPNMRMITTMDASRKDPSSTTSTIQSPSPGAKRRLFDSGVSTPGTMVKTGLPGLQPSPAVAITPPLQLVQLTITSDNMNVYSCVPLSQVTMSRLTQQPTKAKRTGSLALFFRKVYHLAGVRLRDLCDKVGITSEEMRKKIWTCLEYSLVNHIDLMWERHLDQLIMCAIYVICKVCRADQSFQDIMRCYRMQPQAANHVYRSVLLTTRKRENYGNSENCKPDSDSNSPVPPDEASSSLRSSSTLPIHPPPTPSSLSGTGSQFEFEERGDLVAFYNKIYVPVIQEFARKFSQTDSPPLSPLPSRTPTSSQLSPRRQVSSRHALYVSPLKQSQLFPSPCRPLSYSFKRDSPQELRNINQMMKAAAGCKTYSTLERKASKRILMEDDEGPPAKQPSLTLTKIQQVMNERRGNGVTQNGNDENTHAS